MKNKVIELLKQGKLITEIKKELNIKDREWKSLGLSNISKYNNIFGTINEVSAYWLGFLWADGSLSGNVLELEINTNDEEHLKKFTEAFSYIKTPPIVRRERHSAYTSRTYFGSKEVHDSLIELGFNKKGIRIVPNIPQEFLIHFIRGYFDGDGSYQYRVHNGIEEYRLDISGPKEFIEYIEPFLPKCSNCEVIHNKSWDSKRIYWYGKENVINLLKLLSDNSTIKLERKYILLAPVKLR